MATVMTQTDWPRSTRPVIMGTQYMVSAGHYLAAAAGVRICRALRGLVAAGAVPERALAAAAARGGNLAIEAAVLRCCSARGGAPSIEAVLERAGAIPASAAELMRVVERDRGLVPALDVVAAALEAEARVRLDGLAAYGGPVAMAAVGGPPALFAAWSAVAILARY